METRGGRIDGGDGRPASKGPPKKESSNSRSKRSVSRCLAAIDACAVGSHAGASELADASLHICIFYLALLFFLRKELLEVLD